MLKRDITLRMTSALFTNIFFPSLTQSKYFGKVTISGSQDSRMTASNTMSAVRLFIFLSMKAGEGKSSAFTVRERFSPVITRMISALSSL